MAYEYGKRFLYKFKLKNASECGILIEKLQKCPNTGSPPPDPLLFSVARGFASRPL